MSFSTSLTTWVSAEERSYTGSELRPHFLLTEFGLKGSGICAFAGSCRVQTEQLVDWEDRMASDRIEARSMIHFMGEFFGLSLREGVLVQRLFMAVALESLQSRVEAQRGENLMRFGDDLFLGERKLSVSIVTASPVSQLLHVGINIDPTGAPVPAVGLSELGVVPQAWAEDLLSRFSAEWRGMEWACVKVRPVM